MATRGDPAGGTAAAALLQHALADPHCLEVNAGTLNALVKWLAATPSARHAVVEGYYAPEYAGLSVALITPFRDGKVDVAALRQQVEFQAAAGTACVCPVGTTGESPTLDFPEHEEVIATVVEAAAGRMKVWMPSLI